MKELIRRLLALCLALALLCGMAAVAEPLDLGDAIDEALELSGAEAGDDLPGIGELALPDIVLEDVAPVSETPAAQPEAGPASNGIVSSGTCGANVRWTLDSDGLLTISGSGEMDNETYFFYTPGIRRVVVKAGVTSIGSSAFNGCTGLESVQLPDGLQYIWAAAFRDCTKLTSIDIPYGVPFISGYAFANCYSLAQITLPESVTEVVDHAFDQCPRLTIRGYDGSFAQAYASANGIPFVSLGAAPARPTRTSLASCRIAVKDQVYSGKAKKPAVKVVLNGKTLKKGADYAVAYANNTDIGTATVTVTGLGSYTGAASATFRINPKAVQGLKLTAGKGQLTARWTKAAGITGYQLQYGLKKSFSGAKLATVASAAMVKKTLKGLKKGKIYFARVRAYKKVSGKVYYSAWSAGKGVKVK